MRVPLTVLGMVLALAGPAPAATFTVNSTADKVDQSPADNLCNASDNSCTLRAAIMQANALVGADVVDVPAGQYKLSLGLLNVTSSITVNGAGATTTTIDANHTDAPFEFTGSGVDSLSDIAFTGQTGLTAGIYIQGPEVTLNRVDVNHETVTGGQGAGIEVFSGQLSLTGSAVTDNADNAHGSATLGGGIAILSGTAKIVATTIARNTVNGSPGGGDAVGGGIYMGGTSLTLQHVTLLDNIATNNNAAQQGGNLYINGSTQISDSVIVGGQSGSAPDCVGNPTVTGRNVYSGGSGDCTFPADTVAGTDPGLNPLGSNGGVGLTAVPAPGGAALDAASACPDGGADQRGTAGPVGAACDIGAVEASADLKLSLDASAASAKPGEQISYVAKVTNAGPDAEATRLDVALPAGSDVVLVTPSTGSCSATPSCALGILSQGQSATVTVVIHAPATGPAVTMARALGNVPDPSAGDANATATTAITSSGPPDTTRPTVTGLGAKGRLRTGRAGKLKATLSEAATLKITVARLANGRRVKGHCVARARRGKRCTVARNVGAVTRTVGAGPAVLALPAKLGGRKLAPGRYRLIAVAVDAAGNRSKPLRATVTVRR